MIKDSGNRRKFETGAVRDIQEGKGRCDLLPLLEIATFTEDGSLVLDAIDCFIREGDELGLVLALKNFCTSVGWDAYTASLEIAKHYEEGANKYGERNWEKGIPVHCYIDSAVRHYLKFKRGDTDERHDRAFLWNILCAMWTLRCKASLNDMPKE